MLNVNLVEFMVAFHPLLILRMFFVFFCEMNNHVNSVLEIIKIP